MSNNEQYDFWSIFKQALADQIFIDDKGEGSTTFLERLETAFTGLPNPSDEVANPREDIAFALLNRDAPLAERTAFANRSIEAYKLKALHALDSVIEADLAEVITESQNLTNRLVLGVAEVSRSFPAKSGSDADLQHDFLKLLLPNKPSQQEQLTSACVLFDFFKPYLISELLKLDIYHPDVLKIQLESIKQDALLLQGFYNSIAHAVELTVKGESSLSQEEIIGRLFNLGPLFAKMLQVLQGSGLMPAQTSTKNDLGHDAGAAFQEGIAPPTQAEEKIIANDLPEGLTYVRPISGATVGQVVETETKNGQNWATKVLRPGIEQTIADNTRMYQLLSDILLAFVEAHAEEGELADQLPVWKLAIPFFLRIVEDDLRKELDLEAEITAQQRGATILNQYPGLHVPTVNSDYPDKNHITMEFVKGRKVGLDPANPKTIQHLLTLGLALWKNRFWHGDMHAGNVKVAEGNSEVKDGTLLIYDWGKHTEIPSDFLRNIKALGIALLRKNPKAIAKAYCRMQSPDYSQVSLEEAEKVARDVLREKNEFLSKEKTTTDTSQLPGILSNMTDVIQTLLLTFGLRHQSTIDSSYLIFMRSSLELLLVARSELAKPEYADKRYKRKALLSAIRGSVKDMGGLLNALRTHPS